MGPGRKHRGRGQVPRQNHRMREAQGPSVPNHIPARPYYIREDLPVLDHDRCGDWGCRTGAYTGPWVALHVALDSKEQRLYGTQPCELRQQDLGRQLVQARPVRKWLRCKFLHCLTTSSTPDHHFLNIDALPQIPTVRELLRMYN